jgi:hypothetical protein
MIAIQKLVFSDGAVKFSYKYRETLTEITSDGKSGFNQGYKGEIYDYLNRDMLVEAPVVSYASNTTHAKNIKKILAGYEHALGTKVLDYKE